MEVSNVTFSARDHIWSKSFKSDGKAENRVALIIYINTKPGQTSYKN